MNRSEKHSPPFLTAFLPAGTRLGLAVSGGSDSVALLRVAASFAGGKGWTLRVLHVDHGWRGVAARADAEWVEELARGLDVPCEILRAGLSADATGLEEAGRQLRYGWFRRLLAGGELDAIATGHTLDDQAETVLAKVLRGAWTAGLGGIYPAVRAADLPGAGPAPSRGAVVRPLLEARRSELRIWLESLGQGWREDASNDDPAFTRNRIRRELLPALAGFNPEATKNLAQVSALARDDESYWQAEVERLLPELLLPGRAVRGGGRASSTLPSLQSIAIEIERLRAMHPALRRRVLRAAAAQLGGRSLPFAVTARVMALLEGPPGSTPRREQLSAELRAERTPRELRLSLQPVGPDPQQAVLVPIPGEATGFGVRLRVEHVSGEAQAPATLRAVRPGDRVTLRHSGGAPKRVKEVLERMGVAAPDRAGWPVLEWHGEVVWIKGAALETTPLSEQLRIVAS